MSLSTMSFVVAGLVVGAQALDGPVVPMKLSVGCHATGKTVHDFEITWAPDQCQPDPIDPSRSIKFVCTADPYDELLYVRTYKNDDCTDFDTHYTAAHNKITQLSEEILMNNSCKMFELPDVIREACKATAFQPEGPELALTQVDGCFVNQQTTLEHPIIWAPGVCQRDSSSWAYSMILSCSEDGGLHVLGYEGTECEGETNRDYVIYHHKGIGQLSEEMLMNNSCKHFLLPDEIIEACTKQPEGPELVLGQVDGCFLGSQTHTEHPFVWAPGHCQKNPLDDGHSMILECAEDGSMAVMEFEGRLCQGEPTDDYTIKHKTSVVPLSEGVLALDQCKYYVLPDLVIDACKPAPVPRPQPEGLELVITQVHGCHVGQQTTNDLPVVWGEGECQAAPADQEHSVILECGEEGVRVRKWEAVNCDDEPTKDYMIYHDQFLTFNEQVLSQDDCEKFLLPEAILDACGLAEPEPVASPAPVPAVSCSTYNDPHMRYFDQTTGSNMNRGHFLLYKTDAMEVQTRHGVYLSIDEDHPRYDEVSTNNAFALTGDFVCGALVEMVATPAPEGSTVGFGTMRITKGDDTWEFESIEKIMSKKRKINNLLCGGFFFDEEYGKGAYGPLFVVEKDGYYFSWQVRPFGINIWMNVGPNMYLSTDSGMCTKRGDYQEPLECDEIIFTQFPEGHSCSEETENDQTLPVPDMPACDESLLAEAQEICNKCPDVVDPESCVFETCLLGAIEFAEEQTVACGLVPHVNTCGQVGVIRGRGQKISVGKKDTACECRDACQAAGAHEWTYKAKRRKCQCYKDSKKVSLKGGDINDPKKKLVGVFPGSTAEMA